MCASVPIKLITCIYISKWYIYLNKFLRASYA